MTTVAFLAGIVLTLAFHELDLIRSRDPQNGRFRVRSHRLGMMMLGIALMLIGVVLIGGRR